jgi:hypothetical protein
MCKRLLLSFLALGSWGFIAAEAHAQYPPNRGIPSYNVPTYSPYLNLNRRGGTLSQNYFGIVRPEIDFRQNLQQLNQQVSYNQQAIADIGNQILPATGHTILFNNTSHYFGNLSGPGGGTGAGGGKGGGTGQRQGAAGGAGGAKGGSAQGGRR